MVLLVTSGLLNIIYLIILDIQFWMWIVVLKVIVYFVLMFYCWKVESFQFLVAFDSGKIHIYMQGSN